MLYCRAGDDECSGVEVGGQLCGVSPLLLPDLEEFQGENLEYQTFLNRNYLPLLSHFSDPSIMHLIPFFNMGKSSKHLVFNNFKFHQINNSF